MLGTSINKYCEKEVANIFVFMFAFFSPQNIADLDAGLAGKIWTSFNIDFRQSNSRIRWFLVLLRDSHIKISF